MRELRDSKNILKLDRNSGTPCFHTERFQIWYEDGTRAAHLHPPYTLQDKQDGKGDKYFRLLALRY